MLPVILGLAMGFGLPIQTAINSRLRRASGSPLTASLANFTVGTAALLVLVAATGALGSLVHAGQAGTSWWMWTGGVLGFTFLTLNIVLFPKLGGVETAIWPVAGQVVMALLIDTGGWLGNEARPLSLLRATGAVLAISGVVLAVVLKAVRQRAPHLREPASAVVPQPHAGPGPATGAERWAWRGIGILSGAGSAVQATINGALGVRIGSAPAAALVNFSVGTAILVVAVLATGAWRTAPGTAQRGPWWMWLGGLLGAEYVFVTSLLVPMIGTGLAMVLALTGQTAGSICVDHLGWLGAARNRVMVVQLVGLAVMIAGAVLVRLG